MAWSGRMPNSSTASTRKVSDVKSESPEASLGANASAQDKNVRFAPVAGEKLQGRPAGRSLAQQPETRHASLWVTRIKEMLSLSPTRPMASRTYRYLCRRLAQDAAAQPRGLSIVLSAVESLKLTTDSALLLGYALRSELEKSVLIIDAVLCTSTDTVTQRLGLGGRAGYTDLIGDDQVVCTTHTQGTSIPDVYVLPIGRRAGDSIAAYDRDVQRILDEAVSAFDFVVIAQDCIVNDTRYLPMSARSDVNFLLVEENETYMSAVDDCRRRYRENGIEDVKILLSI